MFVRRHVRAPTIEPDMHVLEPYEYHVDTSELVQMLHEGHYGVELDDEAWDRLITWIDLNTPRYGTWLANVGAKRMGNTVERRRDLMKRYAGIDGIVEATEYRETVPTSAPLQTTPQTTVAAKPQETTILSVSWPHDSSSVDAESRTRSVSLADGSELKLVRIPAGVLRHGDREVRIERAFWMGQCEVTNRQYAMYDPNHDSRLEPLDFLHFDPDRRGSPLNGATQPAVKVTWENATEYCRRLSRETGLRFELPSEAQWQWAARAGTETPLWYGQIDAPFAARENLADAKFHKSIAGSVVSWKPAILDQDDGYRVSAPTGSFRPNPWGLFDMHGNVAEWTASEYTQDTSPPKRTVCGGAWSDRPQRATADMRRGYYEFQKVFNVGFRVVLRDE